jgi:hypothetical protein
VSFDFDDHEPGRASFHALYQAVHRTAVYRVSPAASAKRRSVDQKVLLIMDGHPVPRAQKVKRWLAEREDQIAVFELPGDSPELNPDEYLNQDVRMSKATRWAGSAPAIKLK